MKKGSHPGPGVVYVDDPLQALQDLARTYLKKYPVTVVAITGSNGKTSTKDMVIQVLRTKYSVHGTENNFNNEIGVPLTVLGLNEEHQILVAEMGMRGLGQIKQLTEICPPDYGVITNIGPVHLELLGSMGNVAQAKGELLAAMDTEGIAILNGDDPSVRGQARSFKGKLFYYGLDVANDLVARGILPSLEGHPSFSVELEGEEEIQVQLEIPGIHNVWNACAALAVGLHFDIPLIDGAKSLEKISLSSMRLEVQRNSDGVIIIDDSYNASPNSTKAALDTITHMYCSGRRVIILGDMLELGDIAEEAHREIGECAGESSDDLIFIGEYANLMREGAGKGEIFSSVDEFLQAKYEFSEGDLVLVKASRGLHFERIVEHLMKGEE